MSEKWILKKEKRGFDAAENRGHKEVRGKHFTKKLDALVYLFGSEFSIQPLPEGPLGEDNGTEGVPA